MGMKPRELAVKKNGDMVHAAYQPIDVQQRVSSNCHSLLDM